MDITLITGAVAAISTAMDIGKTAINIRDANQLSQVVASMNEQLLNAQQSLFVHNASLMELQQKYFQATQELREIKEALAQRDNYTLVDIGLNNFAYRVNVVPQEGGTTAPGSTQPEHYLCQACFDGPGQRKVVLRPSTTGWLHCSVCKTVLNT